MDIFVMPRFRRCVWMAMLAAGLLAGRASWGDSRIEVFRMVGDRGLLQVAATGEVYVVLVSATNVAGLFSSQPDDAVVQVPQAGISEFVFDTGARPSRTFFFGLRSNGNCTPVDNDGDGIDDVMEALLPYLDALDPGDAAADFDADGWDNRTELYLGTNPAEARDVFGDLQAQRARWTPASADATFDGALAIAVANGMNSPLVPAGAGRVGAVWFNANADVYPDLASIDPFADELAVYAGAADGTLSLSTNRPTGATGPLAVAAAPFIGDAAEDLAVGHVDGAVTFFLGDGAGHFTFRPDLTISNLGAIVALAAADLDGDGDADLAVSGGDRVTVLANDDDPVAVPPVANGEFENGLSRWNVTVAGTPPGAAAGRVSVQQGHAALEEGGSFRVTLSQTLTLPPNPQELRFDLLDAHFEETTVQPPDAFDVTLRDARGQPLAPVFRADADALFNRSRPGADRLGAATALSSNTVSVSLAGVTGAAPATLEFALVGSPGAGASVLLDHVRLLPEAVYAERFTPTPLGGPFLAAGGLVICDADRDGDADVLVEDGGLQQLVFFTNNAAGQFGREALAATDYGCPPVPPPVPAATGTLAQVKFLVADGLTWRLHTYAADGTPRADVNLAEAAAPLALDARADGTRTWVLHAGTNDLWVYDANRAWIARWAPAGLEGARDVAVAGTDLWMLDQPQTFLGGDPGNPTNYLTHHRLSRFADGANRLSGSAAPDLQWNLPPSVTAPSHIMADGVTVWVLEAELLRVNVFDVAGVRQGSWKLDASNGRPAGLTRSGVDVYVADVDDLVVYRYAGGVATLGGTGTAAQAFSLSASNLDPVDLADPPEGIALDTIITGSVAAVSLTNYYTFTLPAPTQLLAEVIASEGDGGGFINLSWSLADATGSNVFEQAFYAAGPLALAPGLHTLAVSSSFNTGTYSFLMRRFNPGPPQAIASGSVVDGSLSVSGEVDRFTFEAAESGGFYFHPTLGAEELFQWRLLRPDDTAVVSDYWYEQGYFYLAPTGTYAMEVWGAVSTTGDYQFTVDVLPLGHPTPIAFDTLVTNLFAVAPDLQAYSFAITNPTILFADMIFRASSSFDWTLLNPAGGEIFDLSLVDSSPVRLTTPGTYRLHLETDSATGGYTFNLRQGVVPPAIPIALDTNVSGSITNAGGTQPYVFDITNDLRLIGQRVSGSAANLSWSLADPAGNDLYFRTFASTAAFDLSITGRHTVVIYSQNGRTGAYTFRLNEIPEQPPSLPVPIDFNVVVSNTLPYPFWSNRYSVAVSAPRDVSFDAITGASADLGWRLQAPDGDAQFDSSFSDRSVETLAATGTYELVVYSRSAAAPVAYTFEIIAQAQPAPETILLDQEVSREIAEPFQVRSFEIALAVGQKVKPDTLLGSSSILQWSLTDPATNTLFTGSFASRAAFIVATSGNYRVEVRAFASQLALFTFVLRDVPPDPPPLALVFDELYTPFVIPGQTHTYTFDLDAPKVLFIEQVGFPEPFVIHTLLPSSGPAVYGPASGQDYGTFTVSATGAYTFLVAGSTYTGSYSFILWDVPQHAPVPIGFEQDVAGALQVPGEVGRYAFEAAAGERVYLETLADGFPFRARLVTTNGIQLGQTNLRRDLDAVTLPATGTYWIEVDHDYAASGAPYVGDFFFRLWKVAALAGGELLVGDQITGGIPGPRGTATYTFAGQAGARYYFDRQNRNGDYGREGGNVAGDFAWRLRAPSAALLFDSAWRDVGPITLPETGAYALEFEGGYESEDRLFQFQVWPYVPPAAPQALTRGTVAHGELTAPALTNLYTFAASAGETIALDAFAGVGRLRYTLVNPAGTAVAGPGFDSLTAGPLSTGGTYTVRVTDNFAEGVDRQNRYAFMVDMAPLPFTAPAAPNLRVINVSVPPMLVSTAPVFDVVWTVSNASALAVGTTGWVDRLALSGNGVLYDLSNERYVDIPHAGGLAPGATYSATQRVSLLPGTRGGVNALVLTDAHNVLAESSESDNVGGPGYCEVYDRERRQGDATAIALELADGARFPQGSPVLISGRASALAASENVIFMLDVSGSPFLTNGFDVTSDGRIDARDDLNHDGNPGSGFDLAAAAAETMITALAAENADLQFAIVACASDASPIDPSPRDFWGSFFQTEMNENGNSRLDYQEALRSLYYHDTFIPFDERTVGDAYTFLLMRGGNNLQVAIERTAALLDRAQPVGRTRVIFVADGGPALDGDVDTPTLTAFAQRGLVFDAFQIIDPAPVSVPMQRMADGIDAATNSSGRAHVVRDLRDLTAALRQTLAVAGVTIDGVGVQALDTSGRFFSPYVMLPGTQTVSVTAYDTRSNVATRSLTLVGYEPGAPEATVLTDLGASVQLAYVGTTYRAGDRRLVVDAAAVNRALFAQRTPLEAHFTEIRPPSVTVVSPDRVETNGVAVRALNALTSNLAPGATGTVIQVELDNPAEQRVTLTAHVHGPANYPPRFLSAPPMLATAGAPYAYDVLVADDDGDPVTLTLGAGPVDMLLMGGQRLQWTPTVGEAGSHGVSLVATDDRGGRAEQAFSVVLDAAPSNRPPIFTSAPVAVLASGLDYVYAPVVQDADGDSLAFQLLAPAPGFSVNPGSGRIDYPGIPDGTYALELEAADGRGAVAVQRFSVSVGLASANPSAPLILTTPPVVAVVAELYLYFPFAFDPDGDALTFSLLQGPSNMVVDAASGRLSWTPGSDQLGSHAVLLKAEDPLGAFASQFYTVNVAAIGTNRPPVITRLPGRFATTGVPFADAVVAEDPDGEAVRYALELAPAGMTLEAASGALAWTPPPGVLGLVTGRVAAADDAGATAYATWFLDVRAFNTPPVFVTAPATAAVAGAEYRYAALARDAEDTVAYTLAAGPVGLAVDPVSGLLKWPTAFGDVGSYPVRLQATDERGAGAQQLYTLQVEPDTAPPAVSVVLDPGVLNPGETTEVFVAAADTLPIVARSLTAGGFDVSLSEQGHGVHRPPASGLIPMVGTAVDSAGNTGTVTELLRVLDPTDAQPPVITITGPSNGLVVTAPTAIVGSVTDPEGHLDYYSLAYARVADLDRVETATGFALVLDNPAFVEFYRAATAVVNGVLGTFDTTRVQNDDYVIRVTAYDVNGQGRTEGVRVGVTGQLKLGHFGLDFIDVDIGLDGIPIRVTRRYDSLRAHVQGDFGFGWSLAVQDPDLRETVPGDHYAGFPLHGLYAGARVYLDNPDGVRVGFTFEPVVAVNSFIGAVYAPVFTPDPGVTDTLTVPEAGQPILTLDAAGVAHLFLIGTPYNPDTYLLTRKDGLRYAYNQDAGLQTITDRNGNRVTFTADAIVHSAGLEVRLERDAAGRVARMVAPEGQAWAFTYDGAGDLVQVVAPGGLTAVYGYATNHPHYLEVIEDPVHGLSQRTEYDAAGRVIATIDAAGNRSARTWDPGGFGGTRSDARGNVTALTYDALGNLMRQADPLGGVTTWAYADARHPTLPTTITTPLGAATHFTYDERGNLLQATAPLGVETTYAYDESNQLLSITHGPGAVESFSYDSRGNVLHYESPIGAWDMTYTSNGLPATVVDAMGGLIQYAYESAVGLPSLVIDPAGGLKQFAYDGFGRIVAYTDPVGGLKSRSYDNTGRVLEQVEADGGVTRFAYDPVFPDLRSAITNRAGGVTTFAYDALGRLTAQTAPGGARTQFEYDANGNRTAVVDPLGNRYEYAYDALNHLVEERDPLGGTRQHGYDLAGNRTNTVDRLGRRRSFRYDALNHVVAEHWHDPTNDAVIRTIAYTHDTVGHPTRATDEDADVQMSWFTVPGGGMHSERVTYPGLPERSLTFEFDASGRRSRLSIEGVLELRYARDAVGRVARLTSLPVPLDVTGTMWSLGFVRNARGDLTELQRFADTNGIALVSRTTFTNSPPCGCHIDSIAHVIASNQPLPEAAMTITRDPQGTILEIEEGTNQLVFGYNAAAQLAGLTRNGVSDEHYGYDANGNRTVSQRHAAYTAGPANRLLQAGDWMLSYDAEGNLIARSNGVSGVAFALVWDYRNRLARVQRTSPAGPDDMVTEFRYDALDRRIAVIQNGQTNWTYYDAERPLVDYVNSEAQPAAIYVGGDRVDDLQAVWRRGEGLYWTLTDHLGSVRRVIDSAGVEVAALAYDSFGNPAGASGTQAGAAGRFAFAGREWDASTGLYYNRARYYDPDLGRFISVDPLGFQAGDANLYRYVFNNPQTLRDPSGMVSALEYVVLSAFAGCGFGVAFEVSCDMVTGQKTSPQDRNAACAIGALSGAVAWMVPMALPGKFAGAALVNGGLTFIGNRSYTFVAGQAVQAAANAGNQTPNLASFPACVQSGLVQALDGNGYSGPAVWVNGIGYSPKGH